MAQYFGETPLYGGLGRRIGKSAGLVVWPGKHPSSQPIINNTYLPETVTTVIELKERAERYGCAAELNDGLGWLKKCLSVYTKAGPFSLAVILLARRPFNIIGTDSPIELCPYLVDICFPSLFSNGDAAEVPFMEADAWTGEFASTLRAVGSPAWTCVAITAAHGLLFSFRIRPDWVKVAAEAHAYQLLAACDTLAVGGAASNAGLPEGEGAATV